VALSPQRFAAVAPMPAGSGPGLSVTLVGAPGEHVTLLYVAPRAPAKNSLLFSASTTGTLDDNDGGATVQLM
jgi:hypothetical protein